MFSTPYTLVGFLVLVLDILAIISVITGHGSAGHKILWVVLILLLPLIGLILYFLVGRSASDQPLLP